MSDQEQLTPQQDREYVEAAWERVKIDDDPLYGTRIDIYTGLFADYTGHAEVSDGLVVTKHIFRSLYPVKAIHAAFLFTKDHEQKIAEVWEAMEWITDCIDMSGITEPDKGIPEQRYIQAMLRERLSDLKRGWREKGDGNGRG